MSNLFQVMIGSWFFSISIIVAFYVLLTLIFDRIVPLFFSQLINEIKEQVRVFSTLVSIVGVFYGILFGFVVVNQW
jgi:hypothetical protein